jgi:hypothetical protein
MSTVHLHRTTTLTPQQYIAGLTDFEPGRSKIFGNSADEYLKVHHKGLLQADVTEGSGGIWERLRYDWSDPNRVVLTTTDSNVWGGASGHTYTFTRRPDGTTDRQVGCHLKLPGHRFFWMRGEKKRKAIRPRTTLEDDDEGNEDHRM